MKLRDILRDAGMDGTVADFDAYSTLTFSNSHFPGKPGLAGCPLRFFITVDHYPEHRLMVQAKTLCINLDIIQPARGPGGAVSSPSGVWGEAAAAKSFDAICVLR